MSLQPPTTTGISSNIVAELESSLSQTIPLLPKAFSRVLAKVLAAVVVLLYKYSGFIFLQLFIRYATIKETNINGKVVRPLVEKARELGVDPPEPRLATRAQLRVWFAVHQLTGTLPARTKVLRAETGVVYETTAPVALDASTVVANIVAIADQDNGDGSGEIGTAALGTQLEFASPPAQISRECWVTWILVPGADAETEEEYRKRVLETSQKRPQGGAYADYMHWARSVSGVVAAYPYTGQLPGEIDLYVEVSKDLDPDGIPDAGVLALVEEAVRLNEFGIATRKPINAGVNVLPITRVSVAVVVSGLIATALDNAAEIQEAVELGLDEHLRSLEPYIEGLSLPPRNDIINTPQISGIVSTIAQAGLASVAQVTVDGSVISATILEDGQKAKLGSLTWN